MAKKDSALIALLEIATDDLLQYSHELERLCESFHKLKDTPEGVTVKALEDFRQDLNALLLRIYSAYADADNASRQLENLAEERGL